MKKLQAQLFCFLITVFLWPCICMAQESQPTNAGDGKRRDIVPDVQSRLEAARAKGEKRRREYTLQNNIVTALVKWDQSRKKSDADELDAVLKSIMDSNDLGPMPFFYGAQVAHARGNTPLAIALLNQAIDLYPDEKLPGNIVSVAVLGRLWIGYMQRQVGDDAAALATYETLRKQLDIQQPGEALVAAISWLNTAQVAAERAEDAELFEKSADSLLDITTPEGGIGDFVDFLQKWVSYKRMERSKGRKSALSVMAAPRNISLLMGDGYLAANGMGPCYVFREEGQAVIQKLQMAKVNAMAAGTFDKNAVRLARAATYAMNQDYARAEADLKVLFDEGTFFSPIAGLALAERCKHRQKDSEANDLLTAIATKYPGYAETVNNKRNKWLK